MIRQRFKVGDRVRWVRDHPDDGDFGIPRDLRHRPAVVRRFDHLRTGEACYNVDFGPHPRGPCWFVNDTMLELMVLRTEGVRYRVVGFHGFAMEVSADPAALTVDAVARDLSEQTGIGYEFYDIDLESNLDHIRTRGFTALRL